MMMGELVQLQINPPPISLGKVLCGGWWMNPRGTGTCKNCSPLYTASANTIATSKPSDEKDLEEGCGETMKDGSLSFTCEGEQQSEGETEREVVKDLKDSQTCEYRFYKTLY